MKSIIQTDRECYVTGRTDNLHKHHCIHGKGRRPLSDKYGLWVYITGEYHNQSNKGIHTGNSELDLHIKQVAQRTFEEKHSHELFMEIFGENYL